MVFGSFASPLRAADPDVVSPLASYVYLDTLADPPSQPNVVSPLVSYLYYDSLATPPDQPNVASPLVSYLYLDSLATGPDQPNVVSPLASYLYCDWPGDENLNFETSPAVSYFYPYSPVSTSPRARPETLNISPASGALVQFYGYKSTPSSGCFDIASYLWDFGDGTISTLMNPTHAFFPTSSRAYGVTLRVTDTLGYSDQQTLSIYVSGQSLGVAATTSFSKDPVNLATGNYVYEHVDLRMPGKGFPFEFRRFYNSKFSDQSGLPLGYGWTHSFNIRLSTTASNATVTFGDGSSEMHVLDGGQYVAERGIYNKLLDNADTTYTLTTKEQVHYIFDSQGRLLSVVDKNTNTLSLAYEGNLLTNITDTAGRNIAFENNANGLITQITDPIGRTNRFEYDAQTNLVAVINAKNGANRYAYDSDHQMTAAFDPRGTLYMQNVYDELQRVVSYQTDAYTNGTSFAYDSINRETFVTNALGYVSIYGHDERLLVTSIVDEAGNQQFFGYDTNRNRVLVQDKNGNLTQYGYDERGNVTNKIDALNQTTLIEYDALNNPLRRVDALTHETAFGYDANGNLTTTTNALGDVTRISYTNGLPMVLTDPLGNSTTNSYDAEGNLVAVTDANGFTSRFDFDGVGRRIRQIDALNRTNLFAWDNSDNLLYSVDALGFTNAFTYDSNNNRTSSLDPRNALTTTIYDLKDRVVCVINALGNAITNEYDALDRKIRTADARGNVTWLAYDAIGNLVAVTNALGQVTRYVYDANGNQTSVINPLGRATTNVFDTLNRLIATVDPLGHTNRVVYDALGRKVQTVDALSRTNQFAYDAAGRLIQVTDAKGGITAFSYDAAGNRLVTTDPNGHSTTNTFDALNRLVQVREPGGGVYEFKYDGAGNRTSQTDPNGQTILYSYDASNRRTSNTYPTGAPVTFAYDANGNLVQMTDSLGVSTYQYDALNRLTSVTDAFGKTVEYAYDAAGNRVSIKYPGNKSIAYGYDALNRMASVTDWQNATTAYAYDAAGNLIQTLNPNATQAAYAYDAANRLIGLTNTAPYASIISSYNYTLDAVGNHLQVNQTEPLDPVPVAGNFPYIYDADNRMISAGGLPHAYDANGNTVLIGATNQLVYEYENRLTQTVFGHTNMYQYDGMGNRRLVVRDGVTNGFVLDVSRPLSQILATTDASGSVTAYYVYGLGLISKIEPGGATRYYHYDSRGSTVAITDSTGAMLNSYAYDPFGQVTTATQNTENMFRYLGRYGVVDESNGLSYIRARYYSAARGRFLTEDPLTGSDGDGQSLNRYVYALNNPVRLVDISGLSAQEVSGAKPAFATSDSSLFHNFLVSPTTSGLAGTTPQIQTGGAGFGDRIISMGDVLSTVGTSDSALKYLQASQFQRHLLNGTGTTDFGGLAGVSTVIGMAGYTVEATGGLNNIVAGWANAKSNIKWLFNGATTDDVLNFALSASTQITAVTINTIASPVLSAINAVTGQKISVTGTEVQNAVQGYVNTVDAAMQGYSNGINAAGNWLYQETGF